MSAKSDKDIFLSSRNAKSYSVSKMTFGAESDEDLKKRIKKAVINKKNASKGLQK